MQPETSENDQTPVKKLPAEKLSWLLDKSIRLPGGLRIGLDGLIGLIPGIGDFVTGLLSFWILIQASRQGASKSVLFRMLLNIGIDMAIGSLPVVGDLFDFFWMANERNIKLLQNAQPITTGRQTTHLPANSTSRFKDYFFLILIFCAIMLLAAIILLGLWQLMG